MKKIKKSCTVELLLNEDVVIKPNEAIELSMACEKCKKTDQTIDFLLESDARCQEGSHTLNGHLTYFKLDEHIGQKNTELQSGAKNVTLKYFINYSFKPFKEIDSGRTSSNKISWGRVRFDLTCSKCQHTSTSFTQPNIARPRKIICEKCKHLLAIDQIEQPIIKLTD